MASAPKMELPHLHHVSVGEPATDAPAGKEHHHRDSISIARGDSVRGTSFRVVVRQRVSLAQQLALAYPAFVKFIEEWFTTPEGDERSAVQIERERYVFWAPWTGKFQRWMIVLPSFFIQLCLGSLYSWSIFNASMDSVWGTIGANANTFTIAIAAEGLATLLLGNFIERQGPYRSVLYALALCPAAWAFACLGAWQQQIGIVYALCGVPLGLAGAFGFVCCVANMQRWFPDFKGLAAGFTVMGFGLGAFMWQLIGSEFMRVDGPYAMQPWQVMGIFAIFFAILIGVSVPFIRAPPPDFAPPPPPPRETMSCFMRGLMCVFPTSKPAPIDTKYTFLSAVIQLEFVLICLGLFGLFMPGSVFISSAADMTKYVFHRDASYANLIAAMLNLMNFTGRVIWGVTAERVGRKTFFLFAGVVQAVALAVIAIAIHFNIFGLWLAGFFVIGSVYGGVHGVLPAFLGQMFGARIAGALHGALLFVWSLAVIIGVPTFSAVVSANKLPSTSGGKPVGSPYAYQLNAYWLAALPATSFLVLLFLDTGVRDRILRKAFHECRVRICGRVCVIKCLDAGEQEIEYDAYVEAMQAQQLYSSPPSTGTTGVTPAPGNGSGKAAAAAPAEVVQPQQVALHVDAHANGGATASPAAAAAAVGVDGATPGVHSHTPTPIALARQSIPGLTTFIKEHGPTHTPVPAHGSSLGATTPAAAADAASATTPLSSTSTTGSAFAPGGAGASHTHGASNPHGAAAGGMVVSLVPVPAGTDGSVAPAAPQ